MKIVFHTQIRENYGAHDWDGEGECPQRWKYKGGNTYVVNCDLTQAMDKAFWERASDAVTEDGDYFEEYVLSSELIDDIDYVESQHVAEWDAPYYLTEIDGGFQVNRTEKNDTMGYMRKEIAKKYETYVIRNNTREDYQSSFEMVNGQIIPYAELSNWFEAYAS
jgi:hypothetical protein